MLYHANVLVTACDGRTSPGTVVVPSLEVLPDNHTSRLRGFHLSRRALASETLNPDTL